MRLEYEKRRNVVMEELDRITGFSCTKPRGAFYAFPNVSQLGKTSIEMSDLILERARVATIPGVGFGEGGEGHIRLTFTNPDDELREALRRIKETVELL
jgi:aspartate/methionine/tyrosine aminotransferase